MLGCHTSAIVYSPESSICRNCPRQEGCHSAALTKTKLLRPKSRAAFLSVNFATINPDQDDQLLIALADASARIKSQALQLNSKGFSFAEARAQLKAGKNPFEDYRTQAAYADVFRALLLQGTARKRDLVDSVMQSHRCSRSTASGLVSDALGIGALLRVVTLTRFTATLHFEEDHDSIRS